MQPHQRKVLHSAAGGRDLFEEWFQGLSDTIGQTAVVKRLSNIERGDFGDHRYVGDGVWELRIHFGPGYRVYYGEDGPTIVLLICGGDKGTQKRDIRKAQFLWGKRGKER